MVIHGRNCYTSQLTMISRPSKTTTSLGCYFLRNIFSSQHGTDRNFYSFRRNSVCFCWTENTWNSVLSHSTEIKKGHHFVLNHFVEEKEFRSEPLSIGKYCWKLIPNHSMTKKSIRMTLKKHFFAEFCSVPNLGMRCSEIYKIPRKEHFFRGIRKTISILYRGFFSEWNFNGNSTVVHHDTCQPPEQ